jgi:hypothetical protein
MDHRTYAHRFGDRVIDPPLLREVTTAISLCGVRPAHGASDRIRQTILADLAKRGWSAKFELDPKSKITITALKLKVGLCVQTGNMARMYADLLKLQTLCVRGSIECGCIVLPTHAAAKKLGSNIANFERLVRELPLFEQVVTMPIVVLGME